MTAPVLEALEEHATALRAASHLYVGYSGGKDSHCLLHALVALAPRLALPSITAIHVNHGLHGDAKSWAQHCRDVSSALNVQLVVESVAVGTGASPEAQARNARYSVFERYLSQDSLLLLAHHLDDQVETVLFRLLRGAGPSGLRGIPLSRSMGKGQLLRPFLGVSRSQIEEYASTFSLESVEDPSNADTTFDRNFLRHRVLPLIEERWPGYRAAVARTGQIMTAIDESPSDLWYECPLGALSLEVDGPAVETLHTQIRNKLKVLGLESPAHDALKEFCRQCVESRSDKVPNLTMAPYALFYWRKRIQLVPVAASLFEVEAVRVGESIDRPWGRLSWQRADVGLAAGSTVSLRQVASGEKVKFPNRPNRALRDCMQEAGIAPYWRASVPIACSGGEVVAVPELGCTEHGAQFFNGNSEGLVPVWRAPKIRIGN